MTIPSNGRLEPAPDEGYYTIPARNRYPYVQSYSLTYQRDIGRGIVVDAGYIGSQGRRLPYNRQLNYALPGTGTAGMMLNQRFGRTADTIEVGQGVNNNYNSLQLNATRRLSNGLAFTVAYTFSKSLDVGSNQPWFDNMAYFNLNYGPADFDRTHMLNISHVYELPFGAGKKYCNSGLLSHIVGNWQLNGIFRAVTGTPNSVWADSGPCDCPGNGVYADATRPISILGGVGRDALWFDPSSFAQPGPNRFGTAGRNIIRSPGFRNYDMSAFRKFRITERANLDSAASSTI